MDADKITLEEAPMRSRASTQALPKPRLPKKKPTPRAVYKTSMVTPDLSAVSDDETVIMRLNVSCTDAESDRKHPDAYNSVEQVSHVGTAASPQCDCSTSGNMSCCVCMCVCVPLPAPLLQSPDLQPQPQTQTQPQSGPHSGPQSDDHASTETREHTKRVIPLLAEFTQKSRNSEWPSVTSVCCYWCCHGFANTPVGLPVRRTGEMFHVMGCFCSLECAAAYNFGMPRVSVDRSLERFMLINSLASKIGVGGGAIKPAPDRLSLTMFGGPLGIKEFRSYGESHRHVMINQPPMLTLTQQVEEVDELDMKSAYSYIPLDIARVEKFQEKVRLRRTRPLVDPKNTLDHCMKLRYGTNGSQM